MDSFDAEPIPGTEGARAPFLSPDGSWVGFYSNREVKKVSLRGGALSSLCTLQGTTFRGGDWGPEDNIAFAHCSFGLRTVPATGGSPEIMTSVVDIQDEEQHVFPQFLPGGEAVIYTVSNSPVDARIAVHHLSTGDKRTLIDPGFHGRYVSTGHIVYAWEGELLAVPFDIERLEVTGLPVRVLDDVLMEGDPMAAHFSISNNGSLVYVPGDIVRNETTLVWVDHTGKTESLPCPSGQMSPRVSPDGNRVLISHPNMKEAGFDLWICELERGIERRLTGDEGDEWWGVWTPDSRQVVFNSGRRERVNLYWKPVDGSGPEEVLVESEYALMPYSFSADGSLFAFHDCKMSTNEFDIWVLPMEGDRRARPFLQTKNNEIHPAFSPDGRWLAYVSNESGRWEVYVRPYPGPGPVDQVSTEGGYEPCWSPDGREIYYRRSGGDQMLAVSFITDGPSPQVGKPRLLFEGNYRVPPSIAFGRTYDLSPDGKRFLMIQESEPPPPPTQYNIVLNWFEELKRLVPTDSN
jgi:serine/threonine-protein kinase